MNTFDQSQIDETNNSADLENQEIENDSSDQETRTEQETGTEQKTDAGENAEGLLTAELAPFDDDAGEQEAKAAPTWVKELRKQFQTVKRENRELKQKLEASSTPNEPTVLKKPTLEEFGWDEAAFEKAYDVWAESKRKAETEKERTEREWKSSLENYATRKKSLKVDDFDDAESAISETLNVTQQGILLKGCANPEVMVYRLGKSPKKLQELASISDPVKFAFELARLETQMKTTSKAAPAPEKIVSSGAGSRSSAVDSTLERLRAEAEKTGNYTKVTQYKMQLRNKG